MVPADVLTPVAQVGHEIRMEFLMVVRDSRIGQVRRRFGTHPPLLPELRAEDGEIVDRRKAGNHLQMVRYGAVRR